jgi:hypothetical protein
MPKRKPRPRSDNAGRARERYGKAVQAISAEAVQAILSMSNDQRKTWVRNALRATK